MYKIILVDDDRFALSNLASAVDWEGNGFELAGSFVRAGAAIEFIAENPVDAVITDIKMPGMDGADFAEYLHMNYPKIAVVLLSGYDSFEYARRAIKYNVIDYVLKPVTMSEMERVLLSIKKSLVERRSGNSAVSSVNTELQEFITNYIFRKTGDVAWLKDTLKESGIKNNIKNVPIAFISVRIEEVREYLERFWGYGRESLNNAINNLFIGENVLCVPISYYFDLNEYIMFLDCGSVEECKSELAKIESRVAENAKKLLNLDIVIKEKKIAANIYDIFDNVREEFIDINVNSIYELINSGDSEAALEEYRKFADKIKHGAEEENRFCKMLAQRIEGCKNFNYYSDGLKAVLTAGKPFDAERVIKAAADENSALNIYDYIAMAKRYVNENYSKNITVSDVAKYVSLSDSWFSRMFKKETDSNFTDYLNYVRIEKAVELLKTTNLSVNEIYGEVGYGSRNHFYMMFKRYTGYSAQEYRKRMKEKR